MDGQTDKAVPRTVVLSRPQRVLVGVVSAGVVTITGLGFAGSYTAVQHLAAAKGFGWFAQEFPLGVDAGIGVFLALDLLLAALKMPYAPLRPFAWFLTGATVVFNASVSWGDPLAVGMHAVIPTLFVTAVEAARHAVARIAQVNTASFIESPPFIRWVLAPVPTYVIWRRMRMWHMTSYLETVRIQQETLSFKVRMRSRHGRWTWKKGASESELLALRLSRYGTPVSATLSAEADRTAAESAVSAPVRPAPGHPAGQSAAALSAPVRPAVSGVSLSKAPVRPGVSGSVRQLSAPVRPAVSGSVRQLSGGTRLSDRVKELMSAGHTDSEIRDIVSAERPGIKPDSLSKSVRRARTAP